MKLYSPTTAKQYYEQLDKMLKRFKHDLNDSDKRKKFFEGYRPDYYFKRKEDTP